MAWRSVAGESLLAGVPLSDCGLGCLGIGKGASVELIHGRGGGELEAGGGALQGTDCPRADGDGPEVAGGGGGAGGHWRR
ncbi:MAG: hypothetical protein ACO3ST_00555 [Burkholderiaceae bacterium]